MANAELAGFIDAEYPKLIGARERLSPDPIERWARGPRGQGFDLLDRGDPFPPRGRLPPRGPG